MGRHVTRKATPAAKAETIYRKQARALIYGTTR
jgi:hypothetical protein